MPKKYRSALDFAYSLRKQVNIGILHRLDTSKKMNQLPHFYSDLDVVEITFKDATYTLVLIKDESGKYGYYDLLLGTHANNLWVIRSNKIQRKKLTVGNVAKELRQSQRYR